MYTHIYIDGPDGAGKTSIVKLLKQFHPTITISDRSILTPMSILPISSLPSSLPSTSNIINQMAQVKKSYPPEELITNRDHWMKIDIINDNNNINDPFRTLYIVLVVDTLEALDRIRLRASNNDKWDSKPSIEYFRSKYLFLAMKYNLPYIDTTNKTTDEVHLLIENIMNSHQTIIKNPHNSVFDPELLELEWITLGSSQIIYANDKEAITNLSDIFIYQQTKKELITKLLLEKFIEELK